MTRTEHDSIGPVEIESGRLWGAQTQRSIENFPIGRDRYRWGRPVIKALGQVKRAAAVANAELGVLDPDIAELIVAAASEVVDGVLDSEFPLVVWQTGSGTQTNMNANEVIANRAAQLAGKAAGSHDPVHPNDHVNRSQSSNDVFPTVMHLALADVVEDALVPALTHLRGTLAAKSREFDAIVKVGRTHGQDATPLTLGQEFSGWVTQLDDAIAGIEAATVRLEPLAIGGTAVGTGLNAPPQFAERVVGKLAEATGRRWQVSANYFAASSAHDAVIGLSAAVRTAAMALYKIAGDIRLLASGPRNGIGELALPSNEPGSSIMPGKVNPTQIEALAMVCTHVFGNDATVAFAGSQGTLELNALKPVMLHATLDSIMLLADAVASFDERCAGGIEARPDQIASHLESNLMVVTALNPHIGYDRAAAIAKDAHARNISLRQAALDSGHVSTTEFDLWVDPTAMT